MKDINLYRKKIAISQELIKKWKQRIPFAYVALDGEYGNQYCLNFLKENNLKYSIRIACNRKIYSNGVEAQLKKHPNLKLIRNEKYKIVYGSYKGIPAYFIAHKRKGKNGSKQVVYIVSNIEGLSAKAHVLAYSRRWPIEKMFRTLKQSFGIRECQSTSAKKQEAHQAHLQHF